MNQLSNELNPVVSNIYLSDYIRIVGTPAYKSTVTIDGEVFNFLQTPFKGIETHTTKNIEVVAVSPTRVLKFKKGSDTHFELETIDIKNVVVTATVIIEAELNVKNFKYVRQLSFLEEALKQE